MQYSISHKRFPLTYLADGTEESREFEVSDESPVTDVLSEVTGRDSNKEEMFDTMRRYRDKDDREDRRPGN